MPATPEMKTESRESLPAVDLSVDISTQQHISKNEVELLHARTLSSTQEVTKIYEEPTVASSLILWHGHDAGDVVPEIESCF